jgi:hypothetical protein
MPDKQPANQSAKDQNKPRIRWVENEAESASAHRSLEQPAAYLHRLQHPNHLPIQPQDIPALQRAVGNKAVQRLLDGREKDAGLALAERSPADTADNLKLFSNDRHEGKQELMSTPMAISQTGVIGLPHQNGRSVQRSAGGKFAKAQIMGLNKTVNPFFGWKGYYKALKDIHSGDDRDTKYGNLAGRVMNGLVETSDRVASFATALTFILTGLGAILAPFFGAGAVILSIATVCGIVATIAHAVTFLLRGIVTIYDAVRLSKAEKGSRERAILKGKMWKNIGGLISNGIGVIMGGLGGGFIGGANVIGGALEGSIGAAAAPTGVLIGEGGNRVADTAAAAGGIKQHGLEKHAPPAQNGQTGASQNNQRDASSEIRGDLSEIVIAASGGEEEFSSDSQEEKLVEGNIKRASSRIGEVLGENEKLSERATDIQESSEANMASVNAEVKKSKKQPSESEIVAAEKHVEDLEDKSEEREDLGETLGPAPQEEEQQKGRKRSQSLPSTVHLKPADKNNTPSIQRGAGKRVKGFLGNLFSRLLGVGKRIKMVGKKIKLKMSQILVRVLGMKESLVAVQEENQQAESDLTGAVAANQEGKGITQNVKAQSEQAKALIDQTDSG